MESLAFALLIAAAAGVFLALPLLRAPSPAADHLEAAGDQQGHLARLERRDRAFTALRELEFDHRTGKVSDADYRELVEPLRLEAAQALEPLDRRRRLGLALPR